MELQKNTSNQNPPMDGSLQLSHITVNEEYREKWNIHCTDFVLLSRNGQPIRDTLYRLGGMTSPKDIKNDYFLLIKHVEDHYSDDITKVKKDKPHLKSTWVIMDKHGNERVEFGQFKSPYLVKDSVLYSIESKYYNIETGEYYCHSSGTMESDEFLFIDNSYAAIYDKDKTKCGIMKINKKDGTYELFKKK